jgi:DNA-binding MarR family transcriptional regulator
MTAQPTPAAALFRSILDLRIEFDILTEKVAKAAGLNPRDLGVLDLLHSQGPSTPKEIAERTGIHPATLTAVLIRLERTRRVTRHINPSDSRSTHIVITPATLQELDSYFAPVNLALKSRMDMLSETAQLTIAEFLEDIGNVARQYRLDTPTAG